MVRDFMKIRNYIIPVLLLLVVFGIIGFRIFDKIFPMGGLVDDVLTEGEYNLVRVVDGDTLIVKNSDKNITVRLRGIDAPEKKQNFGPEASLILFRLLDGSPLRIENPGKDKYGRLLAHIKTKNGMWVNLQMLSNGAAWVYRAKQDVFWADLEQAESLARRNRIGLWADDRPIYPGDWRNN